MGKQSVPPSSVDYVAPSGESEVLSHSGFTIYQPVGVLTVTITLWKLGELN